MPNTYRIVLAVLACVAIAVAASQKGKMKDPRDGKIYGTVTSQKSGDVPLRWMTEPLGGDTVQYMYKDAKNACPDGWRLPTLAETMSLLGYDGGDKDAQSSRIEFYVPKGMVGAFTQDCYLRFFTSAGFRVYINDCFDDKTKCSASIMSLEWSVVASRRLLAVSRLLSNTPQDEPDGIPPERLAQEAEEWHDQVRCVKQAEIRKK
jgi:uncharacterized protein (TIGR02145 family)